MSTPRLLAWAFCAGCLIISSAVFAEEHDSEAADFIVDTSIPFSSGAREHFIPARIPFGLSTFQQGFVDGMHYRIDPDGGALFSPDPRLRNDVIEVECENDAIGCIARKSIIQLSIRKNEQVVFAIVEGSAFDEVFLGYGQFKLADQTDSWKRVNVSLDAISVDLISEYDQLAVVKDGSLIEQVSLAGLAVAETYLKWVMREQRTRKLPASWADSHDQLPASNSIQYASLGTGGVFQRQQQNGEIIYSPLVQFEISGLDKKPVADNMSIKPKLALAGNNQDSEPLFTGYSFKVPVPDLYRFKKFDRGQIHQTIDLGGLSSDQLLNLQHQFGAPFKTPVQIKLIETRSELNDTRVDLRSYLLTLNASSAQEADVADKKQVETLLKAVSRPNIDTQTDHSDVKLERLSSKLNDPKLKMPVPSMSKLDAIAKPDIGGNICKPAILSDVNENSIVKNSIRQAKGQSKPLSPKEFSDPGEALKGLPGVYVFTDYLAEPVHLKGKFNGLVHDAIEQRLKAGGIRVLSKTELETIPGQPRMEVYFSKANVETGCSFAVWVSVRQSMLLGRNEEVRLLSGTWGSGGAHLREYSDAPEFNTIMNHVDRFIAAYTKANS